jgi:hypothetical protein
MLSTDAASATRPAGKPLAPPPTRPIASVRVLTFVGRRSAAIIESGARELPPDSELRVPIVATNSPLAPARAIP